jgi:ankyrin repeat protein
MTNIIESVKDNDVPRAIELLSTDPQLINTMDGDSTLLSLAVAQRHLDMVEILISRGANLDMQDNAGHTALIIASYIGRTDIVERLISAGADLNMQDNAGNTALILASDRGCTDIVERLISAGADLNKQNSNNGTALVIAITQNKIDIAKELISAGADLNMQERHGNTALITASIKGKADIVETLIKTGADLNMQTNNGLTALMIASNIGKADIVEMIINAGADLNVQIDNNYTALMFAVIEGKIDVAKILINAGADLNVHDIDGNTALMWAFHRDRPEVAKALINAGADFLTDLTTHYTNNSDNTRSFALFLKEAGADLNILHNDETPLMTASIDGVENLVTALINAGTDLNKQDNAGNTALMTAIMEGQINIAAILIDSDADLDIQDNRGNTALIIASAESSADIVERLINNNAACLTINDIGWNALSYANNIEVTNQVSPDDKVFIISALEAAAEYTNNVSSFLYNNIASGGVIALEDHASLIDFYELNKQDLSISYTNLYTASPNFVDVEIVIKQAYQAIQSNYLSITGVNKKGRMDYISKQTNQLIKLNSDVENHIFSFLVNKEISDGASKILPPRANILPTQTLANEAMLEEDADIEEVLEAAVELNTILTNNLELPNDNILLPDNEVANDDLANLVGIAAPTADGMDIA